MRAYLLHAASLAAAMVAGVFVLAQAQAEGFGDPHGRAGEITADDSPIPPQRPFSGFDLDRLWAAPGEADKETAEENLDLDGRKPAGPAAPKFRAATAGELKKALAPKPAPEAMRKQFLDRLFDRLRNAGDPGDAQRIAASIERVWLQSDSDTANLLMQRATVSMQAGNYPLALSLFDKLVALEPDWAEAWNQRATSRFLTGDTDGAMADIDRVMKLEPRHFGALAGMGMILQGAGLEKRALEIFNKALAVYPLEPNIKKLVEKLTLEVEGQDI
jgi:tetratricopeptide (TPR) repeat protein